MLINALVPLTLAFAYLAWNSIRDLERDMVARNSLTARMLADSGAGALAFDDAREAGRLLGRLSGLPEIEYAGLFDLEGRPFSQYFKSGGDRSRPPPRQLRPDEVPGPLRRVSGRIDIFTPVTFDRDSYGTLHLSASTAPLAAGIRQYLLSVVLVAAAAIALTVLSALSLQRVISRPILGVADVARRLAEEEDYSVRAPRTSSDEIGTLADGFNAMLDALEKRIKERDQAIAVRNEFIAIASHELKTPLTSLELAVHVLALAGGKSDAAPGEKIQPPPPEQIAQCVELVERQVGRLAKLINNMLDVSRITAGRLHIERERMDLMPLVTEVVGRFDSEVRQSGCELRVKGPPEAQATGRWDRLRLDQVITNLVSNAIKYCPGKPVEVRVEVDESRVRVVVIDQGIGIAPEDLGRIFGQFERAVSARHYGGLGLGLHIARVIVEAHGGTIRVESRVGEGSRFTVELPRE